MTALRPPAHTHDVAVIGGGAGSLTAAALLARAGLNVVVLEQATEAGGVNRRLEIGPYVFNPAAGLVSDPGMYAALVRHLGIADEVSLIKVNSFYLAVLDGVSRFVAPLDSTEAYIESHVAQAGSAGEEVRAFLQTCADVQHQTHSLPMTASMTSLEDLATEYPDAFRYRRLTMREAMTQFIADPTASAVAELPAVLPGLPPDRISMQMFSQTVFTYVMDGAFQFTGGVSAFLAALAGVITDCGGLVRLEAPVAEVSLDEDGACGVVLEDGEAIRARTVISGASAETTFGRLLPQAARPAQTLRRIGRLHASPSAVVLNLATGVDLVGLGAQPLVLCSGVDGVASFDSTAAGEVDTVLMRIPSVVDPTLAPEGEHVVSVVAHVPAGDRGSWAGVAEHWHDQLLAAADRVFPGLAADVGVSELLTPDDWRDRACEGSGASFGWADTPRGGANKRPDPRTSVPGLYLAGKWTRPGGCFLRSTLSGIFTSRMVMADVGADGPQFDYDNLPPL